MHEKCEEHPQGRECDDKTEERHRAQIPKPQPIHNCPGNTEEHRGDCKEQENEQIERNRTCCRFDVLPAESNMERDGENHEQPNETAPPVVTKSPKHIGKERKDCGQEIGKGYVASQCLARGGKIILPLDGKTKPKHQNRNGESAEDRSYTNKEGTEPRPGIFAIVGMLHVAVNAVWMRGRPQLHLDDLVSKHDAHNGVSKLVDGRADDGGDIKKCARARTGKARECAREKANGKAADKNDTECQCEQLEKIENKIKDYVHKSLQVILYLL